VINPLEFCATVQATQLRATRRVIDAWIAAAERVDHVVMCTAREVCREELESAAQICTARSPGEALAAAQAHGATLSRRITTRNTELLRAFSDAGASMMRAAQAYADDSNVDAAEASVEDRYMVPTANGFDPVTGTLQFWNDAYRNLQTLMPTITAGSTPAAPTPRPKGRAGVPVKSA
jgi:hypothetical protein